MFNQRAALLGGALVVPLLLAIGAVSPSSSGSAAIAFDRYGQCPSNSDPSGPCSDEIYVWDINGHSVRRLAKDGASPAWSPSGSRLAYGALGLTVINADGSGRRLICTDPACTDAEPTWSPDEKRIAFASGGLMVVNVDGTSLRPIPRTSNLLLSEPDWSPDGRRFVARRFVSAASGGSIEVIGLDGTRRTIARHGDHPKWSPDGTKILFKADNADALFVVNADGSAPKRISAAAWSATWSPDGKRIAFFDMPERFLRIVTLANRHSQLIKVPPGLCSGYYSCFAPDWWTAPFPR